MKLVTFTGTSAKQDYGEASAEALDCAVARAQQELQAEWVDFQVQSITGSHGGFTHRLNRLSITITASPHTEPGVETPMTNGRGSYPA